MLGTRHICQLRQFSRYLQKLATLIIIGNARHVPGHIRHITAHPPACHLDSMTCRANTVIVG
jgi:hypothetical protein